MAEPTDAEILVSVRTAINDALLSGGAVEFEINGRRVKRDYQQLLAIQKHYEGRVASAQSGGSLRTLASFESRPS